LGLLTLWVCVTQHATRLQKHLVRLLQTLQSRQLEPLLVFSFSK
jgi:hypothetical protein